MKQINKPILMEHQGFMFLNGIRIYEINPYAYSVQTSSHNMDHQMNDLKSPPPNNRPKYNFDFIKKDSDQNSDQKNTFSKLGILIFSVIENISIYLHNIADTIRLRVNGSYTEISTVDEFDEDFDEFEI
jgi:hypothetical protein